MNVILHFFKHLLDGCSNAVAANNPHRGGEAEQAAATRDRSKAGAWHRDSKPLSSSCPQPHSARFRMGAWSSFEFLSLNLFLSEMHLSRLF